jgi:hypothetical protein
LGLPLGISPHDVGELPGILALQPLQAIRSDHTEKMRSNRMQELTAIAGMSVIVEALVEYLTFKLPRRLIPPWLKFYAGMAVGVVFCLVYRIDLMPLLGLESIGLIGPAITGLLIGRGSNVANDLFKRLRITQVPAASVDAVINPQHSQKVLQPANAK